MNVGTLRKVLDNIPDEFDVEFEGRMINDRFEVDIAKEKLTLKSLHN